MAQNNMNLSELLSICIPTYNRPHFIEQQLSNIISLCEKFSLKIYISDNSDNSETENVVNTFNSKLIFYHRNIQNIKDRNFLQVIKQPESEYRWLLSDSTYFDEVLLKRIIGLCESKEYSFIFLNHKDRVKGITSREYLSAKETFVELGWHLTHISAIIYSSEVLKDTNYINRYLDTNFIHHALIFEGWAFNNYKAYWIDKPYYLQLNIIKKNTWTNIAVELWLKRWTDYILSLPGFYDLNIKHDILKIHTTKSKLFTYKGILFKRLNGIINPEYWEYDYYAKISLSKTRYIFLKFCMLIPRSLLAFLYFIVKRRKINFKTN